MDNDTGIILEGYDALRYPAELLGKYEPMECLSNNPAGETLLVKECESGEYFVAKCYLKDSSCPHAGESGMLKSLKHEGIPEFVNEYENSVMVCTVRQYAKGMPLSKYIRTKSCTQESIISIGVQLCDILTYLHRQNPPVIHRDIKPQNIIIDDDNRVWLIDFGIARTYHESAKSDTVCLGTMEFAPPEQYGFAQTDCRADIFSLGVVLCYMLTGETKVMPAVKKVKNRRLLRIIRKCTAFAPEKRYASAVRVKSSLLSTEWNIGRLAASLLVMLAMLAFPALSRPAFEVRDASAAIQFEEPLIEQAVRLELNKGADEPIYENELNSVTDICIFGDKVVLSLEEFGRLGMQNVDRGELKKGNIISLNDIAKLQNLNNLALGLQCISDLTPLQKLDNLQCVDLKHNPVKDLSPLSAKPSLRAALLYDTDVSDFSVLASCENLNCLDAGRTNITSLHALSKLAGLEYLKICDTSIESFEGIQSFDNLKKLEISNTPISDLSPLLALSSLEEVQLDEGMREKATQMTGQARFSIIYR